MSSRRLRAHIQEMRRDSATEDGGVDPNVDQIAAVLLGVLDLADEWERRAGEARSTTTADLLRDFAEAVKERIRKGIEG